jgi:hypothetical protein
MPDSEVAVKALLQTDPEFVQLCKTLLGDSVDPDEVWDYFYGPDRVVKTAGPDVSDVHVNTGLGAKIKRIPKAVAARKGMTAALVASGATGGVFGAAGVAGKKKKSPDVTVEYLKADEDEDAHEVLWSGEVSKVDTKKRQIFGYASVVSIDGVPVVDRQGDMMDIEDIEDAAYQYVMKSRIGGAQHRRNGDQPFHASDLIESFVVTPEKIEKMGLPEDTPLGWWTGFKVHDEETWQDYESGKKTGFSIHGRGKRTPIGV